MPRLGVGLGIGFVRRRARQLLSTPGVLSANTAVLSINGQNAGLIAARLIAAAQGSLAISGQDATLTYSGGNRSITADQASLTITGEDMTPLVSYLMPAEQASLGLSGQDAALRTPRIMAAEQGSLSISGQDATLTKSSSYSGPGDIVSGATTWASPARAYSAAFAAGGTAVMDLVDQAGANPITVNILSTGFVNVAAITAWVAANSVSTIKVTKLYDQTGNGNHWTQATLSQMPTLTLSAINGLPGITCASASAQRLDTPQTLTLASAATCAITFSTVAKRTTNFTTAQSVIGCQPTQGMGISFTSSANTINVNYLQNITLNPVTDNTFHAMQGVLAGASSVIAADGSSNTGSITTGTSGASQGFRLGRNQGGNEPLDGIVMEVGVWTSTAFSGGQITSMNSNQHGSSGYNF